MKKSGIIFISHPFVSPAQYRLLSSACSNIGQAIILFSFATLFVPEAVSLKPNFPIELSLFFLLAGLTVLLLSVILVKKGEK